MDNLVITTDLGIHGDGCCTNLVLKNILQTPHHRQGEPKEAWQLNIV